MITGAVVEFIPEMVDGKRRVVEITRIGLELARPAKAASTSQPAVVLRPAAKLAEAGQLLVGHIDRYDTSRGFGFLRVEGYNNVFFHVSALESAAAPVVNGTYRFVVAAGERGPVANCVQAYCRTQVDAHDGKKLFSIKLDGETAYYEVDTSGTIELLSTISLAKAREVIGKVITHQPSSGHGVKTNTVRPRHDGKQKKAA
jgi:cold shock CspA family protein